MNSDPIDLITRAIVAEFPVRSHPDNDDFAEARRYATAAWRAIESVYFPMDETPPSEEANALLVNEMLRGSPLERGFAEALRGLEHYASESRWLNYREYLGLPGYHARAVALVAIERAKAERDGRTSGANLDTVTEGENG